MQRQIHVNNIILNYKCTECGTTAEQYLCEIIEAGTAFCPECDDDMEREEFVTEID